MMEIGLGIYTVGLASRWVDGTEVILPLLVLHVHRALIGEEHGVATIACGHDTVEHIHSALYCLKQVLRCSHSHEIAGFVLG